MKQITDVLSEPMEVREDVAFSGVTSGRIDVYPGSRLIFRGVTSAPIVVAEGGALLFRGVSSDSLTGEGTILIAVNSIVNSELLLADGTFKYYSHIENLTIDDDAVLFHLHRDGSTSPA